MYTPKKSRIINKETIKTIDEIDKALEKGLTGLLTKDKEEKKEKD